MSDTLRCPDCGHENPAGSTSCEACNFPLSPEAAAARGMGPAPGGSPAAERPEAPAIPRPTRPIRARRPRPAANQALTLWLVFGTILALVVLFVGIRGFSENASRPVPGSSAGEQKRADELRAALEKDSTDVDARVGLADILYNTANWPEAIVHYRSAIHHDSTRTTAIVDLGVCYYNLGDAAEAERLFRLALGRDPHQPVALFNLGIVHERREQYDEALKYFHRALQSAPPEEMQQPITEAMQRVMEKLGRTAPPLPGVR